VVLVGDPRQLGPVVHSAVAAGAGLAGSGCGGGGGGGGGGEGEGDSAGSESRPGLMTSLLELASGVHAAAELGEAPSSQQMLADLTRAHVGPGRNCSKCPSSDLPTNAR
jgi:hypothetical protein